MSRPIQVTLNQQALYHNIQCVKLHAPQQRIMAVVKDNAYGHGAIWVAQCLSPLINAFAVSSLDEALVLRHAGITQPILLLGGFFHADELPLLVKYQLETVIHSFRQIHILQKSSLKQRIKAWLKIDTGMHRLGFLPEQMLIAWRALQKSELIAQPIHLMSHLACADEENNPLTTQQIALFNEFKQLFNTETSLANSAAILTLPQTHADWVRPGIMLYGAFPLEMSKTSPLQPVMTLQSRLISVKHCYRGETVGYGATWRCPEDMRIGVIAAGYGDGYPRHAPIGTPILVNNQRVPLIGRVSMDLITVDLRTQPQAQVDDPVILWGKGLPIEEIAFHAKTIAYELFCNINQRIERKYF